VEHIPTLLRHRLAGGVVIGFVQAQILWRLRARLGPLDHNGIQRCRQQEMIVYVGPGNADSKRAARSLDKQAVLDAQFSTVRGVGADAFGLGFWPFW